LEGVNIYISISANVQCIHCFRKKDCEIELKDRSIDTVDREIKKEERKKDMEKSRENQCMAVGNQHVYL